MKLQLIPVIENLTGKHKNKKIVNQIDELRESEVFNKFIENNEFQFKEWSFYLAITDLFLDLIDNGVSESLVLNVFDEYTLMFVILALDENPDGWKKYRKITLDILINSHKFNVYKNTAKTVRMMAGKENFMMEFFWLIPLFVNNKLLHNMIDDYKIIIEDFNSAQKQHGEIKSIITEIMKSNIKDDEENLNRVKSLMAYL